MKSRTRTLWTVTLACLLGVSASAQEMMSGLFGPEVRRPSGQVEVEATVFERADIDGQDTTLDLSGTGLTAGYTVPVPGGGAWNAALGLARYRVDTDAVLPGSGGAIPEEVWDIKLGAGYRRHFAERRSAGLQVSVGSPSDKPFNSMGETEVNATGFYRVPAGEKSSWVAFLNYGNRRSFLNHVPLPGLAYAYEPSRDTFALVGLPVAMFRTRFKQDWTFDAAFFPPLNGRATLAYDLHPRLSPYVGLRSYRDTFLRADRSDDDDWLRHEVVEGNLGVKWKAGKLVRLDAKVGYTFDRKVYESDSFSDDDDALDLENGLTFKLAASVKL
jgi:hypothetical protein